MAVSRNIPEPPRNPATPANFIWDAQQGAWRSPPAQGATPQPAPMQQQTPGLAGMLQGAAGQPQQQLIQGGMMGQQGGPRGSISTMNRQPQQPQPRPAPMQQPSTKTMGPGAGGAPGGQQQSGPTNFGSSQGPAQGMPQGWGSMPLNLQQAAGPGSFTPSNSASTMGPGDGGAPSPGQQPQDPARQQRLANYGQPQQPQAQQQPMFGRQLPGMQPQQQPMGPMQQPQGGMNIQSSIQPQNVFGNQFMRQSGNMAAAQGVPAMSDVRGMSSRPGLSLGSNAIQAGMGGAVGNMMAGGMANQSAGQQQMGWANAQNNLAGQQARSQEALGWGGLRAQGVQGNLANQNAQQGNMFNFLRQAYGGM